MVKCKQRQLCLRRTIDAEIVQATDSMYNAIQDKKRVWMQRCESLRRPGVTQIKLKRTKTKDLSRTDSKKSPIRGVR